jgi:hypothetical protein
MVNVEDQKLTSEKKRWVKTCPSCSREMSYGQRSHLLYSLRKNLSCGSCTHKGKNHCNFGKTSGMKGKHHSIETRNKISFRVKGINHLSYGKLGSNNPQFGIKRSIETRNKISKGNKGKKRTDEHKQRYREIALNYVKKFKVYGKYNPLACKIFDEINNVLGWNIQHSLNGGEFQIGGYSLDGYDKQQNIAIEYDEKYHFSPAQLERDIIRQARIIQLLNCKFYRIPYDKH